MMNSRDMSVRDSFSREFTRKKNYVFQFWSNPNRRSLSSSIFIQTRNMESKDSKEFSCLSHIRKKGKRSFASLSWFHIRFCLCTLWEFAGLVLHPCPSSDSPSRRSFRYICSTCAYRLLLQEMVRHLWRYQDSIVIEEGVVTHPKYGREFFRPIPRECCLSLLSWLPYSMFVGRMISLFYFFRFMSWWTEIRNDSSSPNCFWDCSLWHPFWYFRHLRESLSWILSCIVPSSLI